MYRHAKAGLVVLMTGVMLANTAMSAFATVSAGPVETQAPTEASVSLDAPTEESQTSGVIHVTPENQEDTSGGPGVSAGPGASSTTSPTSTGTESAVIGTAPTSAQTSPEENVTSGVVSPSETTTVTTETGVSNELSEGQAAELQAEQQAAADAAASNINNPLTVPNRQPHLQTTVLLDNAKTWSQAYVNDQQILTDGQSFSSVSTFLEHIHGDLLYRTYNSTTGWTGWSMNGQQTTHESRWIPVEAIQYRFAGPVGNQYDIYYNTTLSDGTETGWAKNGETAGTMGQGLYMTGFRLAFFVKGSADIANLNTTNTLVSANADGMQMVDGALRYISGNGTGFTGWAWQGSERYYFVDSAPVTGWQYIDGLKYYFQEDGRLLQDVESVIGAGGPFSIRINKQMNCMTIYAQDGGNGYIIPVKSFLTSVGDDTPIGTFRTPEKYRWRLMIHDLYTQYATRLGAGMPILIHSIIYDAPNPFTVWASTYNNMGIARSAGCIRLTTADAKWVYDHCPIGTSVNIYNSSTPGPFERPTIAMEIPFEQTWDPTDPNITQEQIDAEVARIIAKFN